MEFRYSDKTLGMRPSIIRELLKQMSDPQLISFAGGNPAADSFPAGEIRSFSDRLLAEDPVGMLQYSVTEGYGPLREACRAFADRKWPVVKGADEVVITSGSQQVIEFMAKLLCNEGDVVAVEEPAFLGAYNSIRSFGAVLRGVPLEPDGVDLNALEAAFAAEPRPKFFYCIPNFQNPTGYTTSEEKRKAIYRLAVKYGVPVLEDDPYRDIRYSGEDLPPIKHFDTTDHVIMAGSFSKIFSPGSRLGYVAAEAETIQRLVDVKSATNSHTSMLPQILCAEFFKRGYYPAHHKRICDLYRTRRDAMLRSLDAYFPAGAKHSNPDGGLFTWVELPGGIDTTALLAESAADPAVNVAFLAGEGFFSDRNGQGKNCMRMSFGSTPEDLIEEGVRRLGGLIRSKLEQA